MYCRFENHDFQCEEEMAKELVVVHIARLAGWLGWILPCRKSLILRRIWARSVLVLARNGSGFQMPMIDGYIVAVR